MKKSLTPCEATALINGKKMNDALPDSDHILRYCSPIHVDKESENIKASAFRFRSSEEYLSVNWMECFDKPVEEQTDEIRTALSKKLKLKSNGRFTRLRVGTVKKRIQNAEVKHVPEPEDPSYAGIYPGKQDNREATLKLVNVIKPDDVFPALKDE